MLKRILQRNPKTDTSPLAWILIAVACLAIGAMAGHEWWEEFDEETQWMVQNEKR